MEHISNSIFVLGGSTSSPESRRDYHVLLTDSSGDELWERSLVDTGGWRSDSWSVSISNDESSIYLVGDGRTPSDGSGFVARINMDGDSLWMLPFGGHMAWLTTSIPNESGGVYAAGSSSDYSEYGSLDAYLLNVNEEGEELWYQVYGGESIDSFWGMISASDGGFALCGKTSSFGGREQFYIVKTDSVGEEQWSGAYGDSVNSDIAVTIGEMPDGGFVMAGWTAQGISTDMMVIRVNNEGEEIWQIIFGDEVNNEKFRDLVVLENGDIILLGETSDSPDDALMIRLDPDGEVVWEVKYDIAWGIDCYSLTLLSDGGYAFAGDANGRGRNGAFLAVTEPDPANAIWEVDPSFPNLFTLHPAFPNPFNSTTTITYELGTPSPTRITVYDLSGREVMRLFEGYKQAGYHTATLRANDLQSGLYFVRLDAGGFCQSRKLILIR